MVKALPPLELSFDGQSGTAADLVVLHHTPAWWFAEFRGPLGQRIKGMAGSSTLATGFNGHVPGAVVCKAMAMLNPHAEVMLAVAEEARPKEKEKPGDALLAIAADVVQASGRPCVDQAASQDLDVKRARRIRRILGTMAACSYLRDKGWNFETAHRFLVGAPAKHPA